MPSSRASPQVVVLAGGLATRMLPRTELVPKILLPVAGRPFVDWQLERLAAAGFSEVVLCVGHLGELVERHVGSRALGMTIRYSDDRAHGGRLLGTLGALRTATPLLAPSFVVTYGDSYLHFDFLALLRAMDAEPAVEGALAVFENDDELEPSNVALRGDLVAIYRKRKPSELRPAALRFVDYGAIGLRREVIEAVPLGVPLALEQVQADLATRGQLRAVIVSERFYEIGSERGLTELEAHLSASRARPPGGPTVDE